METRRRFILIVVSLSALAAAGYFLLSPEDSLGKFQIYSIDIPPSMNAAFGFDLASSLVVSCRPTTMKVNPRSGKSDDPVDLDLVWPLQDGGVFLDENHRLEIRRGTGGTEPSTRSLGFVGSKGLLVPIDESLVFKIQGKRVFVCDAVTGSLKARREFSFNPIPLRSQVSATGDIFLTDSGWGTFEMMVTLTREASWTGGFDSSAEVLAVESRKGDDMGWSRVYRVRGGGVCMDPDGRFIAYHVAPKATVENSDTPPSGPRPPWPVETGPGEIFVRSLTDWSLVRRVAVSLYPESRISISPSGGMVLWPFHGTGGFFERFTGMGQAIAIPPDGDPIDLGWTQTASWGSFLQGSRGFQEEILVLADPARGELRALGPPWGKPAAMNGN